MLASRVRPCASQFNKFIVPLRARYSSAAETQYEFLKVSVPRTGVGMSMSRLIESSLIQITNPITILTNTPKSKSTAPKPSTPSSPH